MCEFCRAANDPTMEHVQPPDAPVPPSPSRRGFLLASLAALSGAGVLLSGCASQATSRTMPGPHWRPRAGGMPDLSRPRHDPGAGAVAQELPGLPGVLPRSRWTSVPPNPGNMNRQSPIHSITVHHDGMSPFFQSDEGGTVHRLELIRRSHRDRNNWGDIGYHFAVDRAGRVYECRAIAWQGAHVRDHNPGNVGVLALGNFDEQSPTDAQLNALHGVVVQLQRTYRVPAQRVMTHREWPGAVTACPGRSLQSWINTVRSRNLWA